MKLVKKSKPKPVAKKVRPKNRKLPVPGKDRWRRVEWVCVGIDISLSSISLGGLARTKAGKLRTGAITHRWEKNLDYFERILQVSKAHDFMHDLFAELQVMAELDEIAIAIEEAVPIGMLQRGTRGKQSAAGGAWMKQQLQISGALLGGLIRYGYKDVYEIQANQWRKLVADDLGITTHASKWNTEDVLKLPKDFNPRKDAIGKYRAQQWIREFHPKWDGHWPDIIGSSHGNIQRPESSKAMGLQCADQYETLAMAEWLRREVKK
jgi:hypothetical protein